MSRYTQVHFKIGSSVTAGEPLCTLFAQDEALFAEPEQLLRQAIVIGDEAVEAQPLVREIVTAENAAASNSSS
jgi:pyrimidine-nucleoside phosphorylase